MLQVCSSRVAFLRARSHHDRRLAIALYPKNQLSNFASTASLTDTAAKLERPDIGRWSAGGISDATFVYSVYVACYSNIRTQAIPMTFPYSYILLRLLLQLVLRQLHRLLLQLVDRAFGRINVAAVRLDLEEKKA